MYVTIDTKAKKIICAPTCYQEAARIGNEHDKAVGSIVSSVCEESAVRDHEIAFGPVAKFTV